jgi:hypothetical protein
MCLLLGGTNFQLASNEAAAMYLALFSGMMVSNELVNLSS